MPRPQTTTLLSLLLLLGLAAAPAGATDRGADASRLAPAIRGAVSSLRAAPGTGPGTATKEHLCVAQFIECGETILTEITEHDCASDAFGSPVYFDVFFFDGVAGETITATMTSTAFDPFLFLFDPDVEIVADDDNSGPGLAARIVFTLDETSPDWSLTPTPLEVGATGPYTLSLACEPAQEPPPPPPPPPSDGFFTDPQFPDFRFRVTIEPPGGPLIQGQRLADCQEDTVCVAGAVPDRPEIYVRILGPRPNGFLWPTIVRFTPSGVKVEIEQISSGDLNVYELEGVGPGQDDLPGLQDRTGFLP